ncbi:uncharacterized protein [Dysidea avara]|uniref:uncharacterized protein isoform X2 n=1 Tax=Dysidea avara TaxID=196820 RepID=UPI003323A256
MEDVTVYLSCSVTKKQRWNTVENEAECPLHVSICVVDSGTSAEIASLNNVTYVVNAVNPLNISAIYKGGDKSIAAAILYLVCNKTYDNATLSYLFSDVQYYHFELVYSKFCIPSVLSIANTATVAISSGSVNTKVTAVKEQTDCRGYQTRKILFGSVIIIIIVVAVVYFRKRTRHHIQHKEIPLHQ